MKKLIIPILFIGGWTNIYSQNTINSNGGNLTYKQYSFGYSIGEVTIPTIISSSNDITSGVIQPTKLKISSNTTTGIINHLLSNNPISVYPNPVTNILNITGIDNTKVEFITDNGSIIHTDISNSTIDLSGFRSGIYILNISNNSQSKSFKIIKL